MDGPADTFVKADRLNGSKYDVYTIAWTKNDVVNENNIVVVKPKYSIHKCPESDILVIPGMIRDVVNPLVYTSDDPSM